jgi:hypothetical protein
MQGIYSRLAAGIRLLQYKKVPWHIPFDTETGCTLSIEVYPLYSINLPSSRYVYDQSIYKI